MMIKMLVVLPILLLPVMVALLMCWLDGNECGSNIIGVSILLYIVSLPFVLQGAALAVSCIWGQEEGEVESHD